MRHSVYSLRCPSKWLREHYLAVDHYLQRENDDSRSIIFTRHRFVLLTVFENDEESGKCNGLNFVRDCNFIDFCLVSPFDWSMHSHVNFYRFSPTGNCSQYPHCYDQQSMDYGCSKLYIECSDIIRHHNPSSRNLSDENSNLFIAI